MNLNKRTNEEERKNGINSDVVMKKESNEKGEDRGELKKGKITWSESRQAINAAMNSTY